MTNQMKFQKIIVKMFFVMAILTFVFAIIFMTPFADVFKYATTSANNTIIVNESSAINTKRTSLNQASGSSETLFAEFTAAIEAGDNPLAEAKAEEYNSVLTGVLGEGNFSELKTAQTPGTFQNTYNDNEALINAEIAKCVARSQQISSVSNLHRALPGQYQNAIAAGNTQEAERILKQYNEAFAACFGEDNFLKLDATYFYDNIQAVPKTFDTLGLAAILISLTLFVFFTQKRRNYYLSNYIACGVCALYALAISIFAIITLTSWLGVFNELQSSLEFAAITMSSIVTEPYAVPSNWTFVLGLIVFVFVIIVALGLVFNCVWKYIEMKKEKQAFSETDKEIEEKQKALQALSEEI